MVGALAQTIINVTDTAFLGRVGQVELGASALAGIFYLGLTMIGNGLALGAQIIIARRVGEDQPRKVGHIFDQELYLAGLFSLVLFLVLFFSATPMSWIIRSEPVWEASMEYLDIRAYGIFFSFYNFSLWGFYTGIARTKIIMGSTFTMAVVNIVLDYLLIFGHAGFPEMGIAGAAVASLTAEIIACIVLTLFLFRQKYVGTYQMFRFHPPEAAALKKIMNLSLPLILQFILSFSGWFIFFVVVEHLGEAQLAISNILRSIYAVYMIPTWGLSAATNTLVSNIIGQGKTPEVLRLIGKIARLSLLITLLLDSTLFLFTEQIISWYTNDPELIKNAVAPAYLVGLGLIAFSVGVIAHSGLTGTGATRKALVIEAWNIGIYIAFSFFIVYVVQGTLTQAWLVEPLYWSFMGIFSYLALKRGKWKNIKV